MECEEWKMEIRRERALYGKTVANPLTFWSRHREPVHRRAAHSHDRAQVK